MPDSTYTITLARENEEEAFDSHPTTSLLNEIRELDGVRKVSRMKEDESTMDLGNIVQVVISSGAMLALARGVSDWIRRNHGVKLIIHRDPSTGSIVTQVENIDPKTALAITELVTHP